MDPAELSRHLFLNRAYPAVRGDVFFSATDVRMNRLSHMDILAGDHYTRPALVPVMPQRGGRAPHRPVIFDAHGGTLHWLQDRDSAEFAVYRLDGTVLAGACSIVDA